MNDYFILPSVDAKWISEAAPGLAPGLPAGIRISPRMEVLPMGFNWALFLCQEMVRNAAEDAGFADGRMFLDRHSAPDIATQPVAAACVDGAAVVGTDLEAVEAGGVAVAKQLEERGLQVKGVEGPSDSQTFTGMEFDRTSGRISLSRERIWRLRAALLFAADQRYLTGRQMRRLVGHYTWSATLRRELLSVFSSVYAWAEKAGDKRWRLWPSAERELRQAAALVAFAFADSKRPFHAAVVATDSSGAGLDDAGGYGVVTQEWPVEKVRRCCGHAEKWRYGVQGLVAARAAALGSPADPSSPRPTAQSGERTTDESMTRDDIGAFENWKLVCRGRWARAEGVLRTEALLASRFDAELESAARSLGPAFGGDACGRPLAGLGDQLAAEEAKLGTAAAEAGELSDSSSSSGESWPAGPSGSDGQAPPRTARADCGTAREIAEARRHGFTSLQMAKKGPRPRAQYQKFHQAFLEWSSQEGQPLDTDLQIDRALSRYMDYLYYEGFNADAGEKVLAAVAFHGPVEGLELPGARRALAGFRRRASARTRSPLPLAGVMAIVGAAAADGQLPFALGLVLAWEAYLRLPSDLVSTVGASLVRPAARGPRARWGLLLFPQEGEARSKMGHYDEGVMLDGQFGSTLAPFLRRLKAQTADASPLWSFSSATFRRPFNEYAAKVSLGGKNPDQVRHGGASLDALECRRSLKEIQERLRHLCESSTRRYKKGTRYLAEVNSLDSRARSYGEQVLRQLDGMLSGRVRLPPPPALAGAAGCGRAP
ncbi:unnamed protein product [Prorocentrum cordatum]|uniref:Uncharacterized protein n=1 Tax=Prorocentrum cordatum TaxID=2364126 RepID=A0ABN9Y124_9DINO|nr:unnamed protein product [Polarella glacialis]